MNELTLLDVLYVASSVACILAAAFILIVYLIYRPRKDWFLVAYSFKRNSEINVCFCQKVTDDMERLIDDLEENDDGTYIVINVLPITKGTALRWDGRLQGM